MKRRVLIFAFVISVAIFSTAILVIAADSNVTQPSNLTVHEWGTFTSVAGEDGASMEWDTLGCKDDLPQFVNVAGYRGFKFGLQGTVRMETPVMYFYSPREVQAQVQVRFPFGVITEWYPKGDNAIYESKSLMDQMHMQSPESSIYLTKDLIDSPPARLGAKVVRLSPNMNGIDTSLTRVMGAIGWKDVKIQPGSSAEFPIETGASRYYAARATDAAPVTVGGEHEKFLFYRGVGRFEVPLSARVSSGGAVTVGNRGTDAVPAVFLFENRAGHMGFRTAGALRDTVTLERPSLDGSFTQLLYDLEAALTAQGLYPREAQAMVETWKDSWFEEGSRVIYIVPSHTIETILPLKVEPAPSQTARVFVGRIELVTPETERSVEQAFAKGDWSAVERYARFLDPILKRISAEGSVQANQIEQYRRNMQASGAVARCR
jgi:hypothetical protein